MPEKSSSVPSCVFTSARGSYVPWEFPGQEMSQAPCFVSVTLRHWLGKVWGKVRFAILIILIQ